MQYSQETEPGSPHSTETLNTERWKALAVQRLADAPDPLTAEELAPLRTFQRIAYGGDPDDTLGKSLDLLGKPGTLVCATGQQVGLLGGPLYTFAKAVGCIAKAREIEAATGHPTVPVFWIASDDHDFEEAAHAHLPSDDEAEGWTRFDQNRPEEEVGQPVFSIRFGADNVKSLESSLGLEPGTESNAPPFSPLSVEEIEGLMRGDDLDNPILPLTHSNDSSALQQYIGFAGGGAATLETTFARLLGHWFRDTGLVFLTPRLPFLRRRGCEVLHFELSNPLQRTNQLLQLAEEKSIRGEEVALHRHEDAVNLFIFHEGKRVPLRFDEEGERFHAVGSALTWEVEELFDLMGTKPWRFSPNVVTRPMVQDIALPTITYIGGPGERAYLSELRTIYAEEGRFFPEISPRPSLFLVEPKVRRAAENLEIDLQKIGAAALGGERAWAELKQAALNSAEFDELRSDVEGVIDQVERATGDLAERVPGQAVATRRGAEKLRSSLEKPITMLRKGLEKDREALAGASSERWSKIEQAFRPTGHPQERVANLIVPFSAETDPQFPQRLCTTLLESAPLPSINVIETADI